MKVIAIDNSMCGVVAECSTETVLTVQGYDSPHPNGALQVGTLFHKAVERRVNGADDNEVIESLQVEYDEFRSQSNWLFSEEHVSEGSPHADAMPQYGLPNLTCIMAQWLTRHPATQPFDTLHCLPEWAEISFALPLDEVKVDGEKYLVIVTGQLDQLAEEGDELWVVDTKTTGKIKGWWKRKFVSSTQLKIYRWAAEQTTGREVQGCYINAIETATVPHSTRTCYTHTYDDMPLTHQRQNPKKSNHTLFCECGPLFHAGMEFFSVHANTAIDQQWQRDVLWAAKRFAELDKFARRGIVGATKTRTQGTFVDACIFCNYRQWCQESARDLRFAESQLSKRLETREVKVGIYESEEAFAAGQHRD